ncbi:MAG: MFS transporter [Mucispirillum sp.]|nr:MFS transporter [Mucispirillum sp.]
MISQYKKYVKLIYSIILFVVLSLFTVYPHIDILKYRSETVIDKNAKDGKYISSYQLNQNDYISTSININDKIKEMIFKIDTSKIKNNIKIELSQVNVKQIYEIGQSNDINKIIKLEKNKFKAGKLNIKITNTSENNISYIVNYPNKTSGYIKLNGEKDVNAFSIYLKTIYSGSDFLLVSWIVFILILFIQGYISYIVFAKELQDNRVYWLSALLFLLVCILRFPLYTFWAEPIAETLIIYVKYNLDKSFSIIDMLLVTDWSMTYLSSIINIIGRILGLDKYLVMYLYMTGIIIACLWLALFTRISLRKYFPDYIRLIITFSLLSLWNGEAFYINSMFTYWGIYFIIFMYLIDLEKISKVKYILGMILIFLIVNNKMSYIFLVPSAFLMIFYYGLKNKRNLYMQIVIIISCFMNYIIYSILTTSTSSRHSGMLERIFDIDTGIIKMLDGLATVINLQILFPKYTQIFSLFILLVLMIYAIYTIIKNKSIKNNGYILIVILVGVFMSQYIHVISNFPTVSGLKAEFNNFNKLPFYRGLYMLHISVYMLLTYVLYLLYRNNYVKTRIYVVFCIIIIGMLLQNNIQENNNIIYYDYKNIYKDYYYFIKNNNMSIPNNIHNLHYSKNAYQKIYNYENELYNELNIELNKNSTTIYEEYDNIKLILSNKCIISMHNNYADIQYNKGQVTVNFYDKDGNLISKQKQLNESNYDIRTGSYMSFMFKEPICNIDKIEFTDEENKPVWVTGIIILGIVQ